MDPNLRMIEQEIKRSNVRIYVTYILTLSYISSMLLTLNFAISNSDKELVLGLLAGISSASLGVIGFWFGGRKAAVEHLNRSIDMMDELSTTTTDSVNNTRKVLVKEKLAMATQLLNLRAAPFAPNSNQATTKNNATSAKLSTARDKLDKRNPPQRPEN